MKRLWKILVIAGLFILVLAVAAGGIGVYTVRLSFPQTSGTLEVPGLNDRVDVYWSEAGVPHVYAATPQLRRRIEGVMREKIARRALPLNIEIAGGNETAAMLNAFLELQYAA